MWESISPGTTVRPPTSTTTDAGPASLLTASSSPTAVMTLPVMASALATREAGSSVATLPFTRIMSAVCAAAGPAHSDAPSASIASIAGTVPLPVAIASLRLWAG